MEQIEWLDRYLDRALTADETISLEQTLQSDLELSNLFDRVVIARDIVRSSALRSRVRELHVQLLEEISQQEELQNWDSDTTIVKPLWYNRPLQWSARIAASGLLLLLGYSGYQYASTSTDTLYSDKFIPYQLPNVRGFDANKSTIDELYQSGDFRGVVQRYNETTSPTPREQFLTGMALLRQQQYGGAIGRFVALRQQNQQADKPLFDQEIDYYLALAYLGDKQIDEAYSLFEKIKNTPRHLYNQNVTEQDLLKLSLLRWKR